MTTAKIADNAVTAQKITNVRRVITANIMGWSSETALSNGLGVRTMPTGNTGLVYTFAIPYDYAGGDITIREWYYIHDSGGLAKLERTIQRLSASNTQSTLEFHATYDLSGTCCDIYRMNLIPEPNVSTGDIFWVEMARIGDNATDTMGRLDIRTIAIEYEASQ